MVGPQTGLLTDGSVINAVEVGRNGRVLMANGNV